MTGSLTLRVCAVLALGGLSACDDAGNFTLFQAQSPEVTRAAPSTKLVERDIEAPEIFQVSESGLWDGRPSLGGVWVAHPDVSEPERVIIRNEVTDSFVIGALFRKERDTPGPKLQVSSDAAEALGLLAGSPTQLSVTALRREAVEDTSAPAAGAEILPAAASVSATTLDNDPIAAAAAAIDAPAPSPQPIPRAGTGEVAIPVAAAPTRLNATGLTRPFIQVGIFSVEGNAQRTADLMRTSGIIPTVYEQESRGKAFWRVVVGPTSSTDERAEVLKTVKSLGFSDAYFVTK